MELETFLEAVMPTVGQPCPVGCGGWVDHTCADGTGRCAAHCTCDGKLGTVDVTLTVTLADAVDPEEAARRFLRMVRHSARDGVDLVVQVYPHNEGHDAATVTVTAQQQREEEGTSRR